MNSVAVIDYGMGNLHSISKALQFVEPDTRVLVSHDPQAILNADRVVFPGVGAIRDTMHALRETGLDDTLRQAMRQRPVLGICLGMQALLNSSEENEGTVCLGEIPGQVKKFPDNLTDQANVKLKIPHMGWNQVFQANKHPLWDNIDDGARFYFVHSYYAKPDQAEHIAATTDYPQPFASALAKDNVFAVQFHPEKSQHDGLQLLKNFLNWDGEPRPA